MIELAAPPLHLLLTTDAVGGVWRYGLQLSRALAAHNVRVTLVVIGRKPDSGQRAEVAAVGNIVATHHLPGKLEWEQGSTADVAAARQRMQQLVGEVQPDLLHSNQFCFGDIPTACPRLVVGHSDILSWRDWCGDGYDAADWLRFLAAYQRLVEAGLNGADCVVAPSQFMAEALQAHYRFSNAPQVIHNGLDLAPQVVPKEPLAVLAGRLWDQAKNVGVVIEALRGLGSNSDHPLAGVRVLIAGEGGEEQPEQQPQRGTLPLPQRVSERRAVEFLGRLGEADLYRLLARASIYLAVSRYEPFGLAVVEGALHGCAVLANDIPTFRELWGDDAVYFTRNSPGSLRSKLVWLIDHPPQLAEYGAKAQARAARLYTASTMAAAYNLLYRSMIAREN